MKNYCKSEFHQAGKWFFVAALIAGSPVFLLSLPALMIMIIEPINRYGGVEIVNFSEALGFIFILISPLLASYFLGGFVCRSIITNPRISLNASRILGLITALGSLAFFILANWAQIALTDYSMAQETSAERSYIILKAVSFVSLPIVVIVGVLSGSMLKRRNRKNTDSV